MVLKRHTRLFVFVVTLLLTIAVLDAPYPVFSDISTSTPTPLSDSEMPTTFAYKIRQSMDLVTSLAPLTAGAVGISASFNDKGQIVLSTPFPGSPAEKAGLQPKDVVIAINDQIAKDFTQVYAATPDSKLKFTISRADHLQTVLVNVISRQALFCPLSQPIDTTETAVDPSPFGMEQAWQFADDSTQGSAQIITGNTLNLQSNITTPEWLAVSLWKQVLPSNYSVTADVVQHGNSVVALVSNFNPDGSFYFLQFMIDGSLELRKTTPGTGSVTLAGYLEPNWHLLESNTGSVHNTIKMVILNDAAYLYINNKFSCGLPLATTLNSGAALPAGWFGFFALGSPNGGPTGSVVFSNLTIKSVATR